MSQSLKKEKVSLRILNEKLFENYDKNKEKRMEMNLRVDDLKKTLRQKSTEFAPQTTEIGWMLSPRTPTSPKNEFGINTSGFYTQRSPHGRKKILSNEFFDNGGITCLSPRELRRSSEPNVPTSARLAKGKTGTLVFS
jgi:hypothetical protein